MQERFREKEPIQNTDNFEQRFRDNHTPYKIRKTELLKEVGLPIPETYYYSKEDLSTLESNVINLLKSKPESSLIVRFACIPDKPSMPVYYIETKTDFENCRARILEISKNDANITHLILQKATPEKESRNKISGRLLLTGTKLFPIEKVLELYKGSRSTSILNNVDVNDPNFVRLEKEAGGFFRLIGQINSKSTITQDELRTIRIDLEDYNRNIQLATDIILKEKNINNKGDEACFEFSYREGKITFIDID
jgi:hypothetical protein